MIPSLNPNSIYNKRVLLRVDLNMPMLDGEILSMARWLNVLPTIKRILEEKPKKLVILSHLGQPNGIELALSLLHIQKVIKKDLPGIKLIKKISDIKDEGGIFLLENVRFDEREKTLDQTLIDEYLSVIDTVIFDAFSVSHRNHASVTGILASAKTYAFGPLFHRERKAIDTALSRSGKRIAILSGAKISTKLPMIKKMLTWADHVLVGGGIANTLLHASGYNMQDSLKDVNAITDARMMLNKTSKLILPIDGLNQSEGILDFESSSMSQGDKILDIGPKTLQLYAKYIDQADTIIWNGPLGYYESPRFQRGTQQIALSIASASGYSIVGGGDSVAAIEDLNISHQFDYVSTSGGAFLHYVAYGTLPVIEAVAEKIIHEPETA
ncbi:MAG: phosphoglycerate kinase [Pseudomonadota bacterium]|nr:phosphoglycerate kinase [Pseudomonadota bacterium]